MRESFIEALKRKYEAEIASAKATAEVYLDCLLYTSPSPRD